MPDYQKMYHALFNDVTDAITKLQQAQQRTEGIYMDSKEAVLTPLVQNANEKEPSVLPEERPILPKKKPPFHDNER